MFKPCYHSLSSLCFQCEEENPCIHQDYARVAAQYLFIYRDQTDEPTEMIAAISDTPRPVADIYGKGSLIHVHILFYEK